MYSSSPTPSSTPTLHPLHSLTPTATSSTSYEVPQSSSSSRAPSPNNLGVRSRKASSPFLSQYQYPHSSLGHPTSCSALRDLDLLDDDNDSADVTRPSLRKATKDALGLAGQGSSNEGKGKQRERTRAASEGLGVSESSREREVVVHKVLKTDTMASVSLQYGIPQQALRKANRLWATDPIHLRPTLLIPLDECNLPSSSFGLERIAREENGDITVWRREEISTSPSKRSEREGLGTAAGRSEREGLGTAAGRSEREHRIVSPTARRLISTSSFETSPNPSPNPPSSTSDFLAIWDDTPASSSRPSLDSVRSTGSSLSSSSKPPYSPHLSSYLSPYASSNASFDLTPSLPPHSHHAEAPPLIPITPDFASSRASTSFSPAPSTSSLDTTPPSEIGSQPGGGGGPTTLSKRTLKVERLPASQLSFFPPPNLNNPTSPPRNAASRHQRPPPLPSKEESEDLFFGPLANTLTNSFPSLRGLNKYLPTSLTSSSSSGSIALPLSRTSSPHRSRTNSGRQGNTSNGIGSGWNLDYFGGEEQEAAARHALNGNTSSTRTGRSNRSGDVRQRSVHGNGSHRNSRLGPDGQRRVSEIGLEQVTTSDGDVHRTVTGDSDLNLWEDQGGGLPSNGKKKISNRGDVRETFGLI